MSDENNGKSDRGTDGRFVKGHPGGPGRPPGRNAFAMLALDDMGADVGKELFELALKAARGGDTRALFGMLERVWPKRQPRPMRFDLVPGEKAGDAEFDQMMVHRAVMSGIIDQPEGVELRREIRVSSGDYGGPDLRKLSALLAMAAPSKPKS